MDDENKLQPNGLWPAPQILSPGSNSTVSPGGFNIVAVSPGGITDSWKIECWGEATDHHGSEGEWIVMEHWVPDTSFDRFGAYFNFKVRYKQAWIWSDWAECHNLYVPRPEPFKPPRPIISAPSNPASAREMLVIGGVLLHSTVQVSTDRDEPVAGVYISTMGHFIAIADWNVGITRVKAVQTASGATSDPSNVVSIAVKPPTPAIKPLPNLATATQRLIITGVVAGNVTLQVSTDAGAKVVGSFTGSSDTRTFTPTERWDGGTTRVYVVQTANGMASDPSNIVSITTKPSRPAITPPLNPVPATQTLSLTGIVAGNDALQMSTDEGAVVDGAFSGTGSTRTFSPSPPWDAGTTGVKVVQTVGGVASDPSETVFIGVRPHKPVIEMPPRPAPSRQTLTITGVVTGNVTLQMSTREGEPVDGHFKGSGTVIFTPTREWPPGETFFKALQIIGGVASYWSDVVAIAVKPSRPVIATPPNPSVPNQALTVTGIVPGDVLLHMTTEQNATVAGNFTGSGSTRIFTPDFDWAPTVHRVKVVQLVGSVSSDPSYLVSFLVKPAAPAITPPPNPAHAEQILTLTGIVTGNVDLNMFTNADIPVKGEFSGSGADRLFTPTTDWTPGENTVYAIQSIQGVDSDRSDLCTFTVEVRPDAPRFQEPQEGSTTSRYPTIEVAGLPGALHTIRYEQGATLHEDTADVDGILAFTVVDPQEPGTMILEVKQASGGVESDWSAPYRFTVKAPPSTPAIEAPRANTETSRYPRIRGTAATGGEIVLRHALDSKEEFALVDGSTRWSWTAEKAWPFGDYLVQARQIVDGDCSDWTDARAFKVSESRYAIGDATPAMGTPVVGTEQSVMLRVRVISGVTGEVAPGVEVKWRVNGEEDYLATTQTDVNGWTCYRYRPETSGKHEILADLTQESAGVVLTELYEVNAVLDDDWAQAAELYLDGERVDPASEFVLLRKKLPYKLELKFADDSVLIGSTVTLQNFWGANERGLTFNPDLGKGLTINKGLSIHWYISAEEANSGFYGLSLASSILPDWELPGRVEAGDLADAVRFDLDG